MSNQAVVGIPNGAVQVSSTELVQLFSSDQFPFIVLPATDFFEAAYVAAHSADALALARQHPLNSYDITYRYCRTAIRVAIDPLDRSPFLAAVRARQQLVVVRVIATECGRQVPATAFHAVRREDRIVAGFLYATTGEGYLYVDATDLAAPIDVEISLAAADVTRRGYIRVLPA